ncbi:phage tail protein [Caviibacterium pharyngocola]|uniref:Phage tail protein n=1 Tax=Caviibacterium pharyngocola TaxID=28159 RepID=A0A2M8RTD7_9PAST|nr:phage tail protein [Caviibacterium pharyngocola]PJG82129.1 phage tail protein [Caviibacterium pharyngocola]
MATLKESADWTEGIYQIETTDPVVGGENGIANQQAKDLANRTKWLKQEVEKRAPTASPTFTGSPKAPTAAQTVNDTTLATTAYVRTAIAALVGSAPETLDTLAEIATALGSDNNLKAVLLAEIAKKTNQTDFSTLRNLLIGIPFPYPTTAVPAGCLAFNGQTFNKTTYPELAKKYPSGVLPDLRGEFIRGWDNGRGIDSERGILTTQAGTALIPYLHSNNSENTLGIAYNNTDTSYKVTNNTYHRRTVTSANIVTAPTVGADYTFVRPRNISFQYICLAG